MVNIAYAIKNYLATVSDITENPMNDLNGDDHVTDIEPNEDHEVLFYPGHADYKLFIYVEPFN
ncbi:MAG TPA: hypothetical protein ACFCUD_09970 [Cyclobacteriaceae bacterium]